MKTLWFAAAALAGWCAFGVVEKPVYPDWLQGRIDATEQRIRQWQGNDEVFLLPFMTDVHSVLDKVHPELSPKDTKTHLTYLQKAARQLKADMVAHLGDIQLDCTLKWQPANAEQVEARIVAEQEMWRGFEIPFAIVRGNHDQGSKARPITSAEFGASFNGLAVRSGHRPVLGPDQSWGYYDFIRKRVRVVFMNTSDASYYGFSDAQVAFLKASLGELPAGWTAIVLMHKCIAEDLGYWDPKKEKVQSFRGEAEVRKIMEGFAKRPGVHLAGAFCGDSHFDTEDKRNDVCYFVSQGFGQLGGYTHDVRRQEVGRGVFTGFFLNEDTMMDVIAVKPKTGETRLFRIGAGDAARDRWF